MALISIMKRKNQQGFTITELLVVLAIFSTVILIITDIFINISVGQKRTYAWQEVQNELRVALDSISHAVRTGQIDYSSYPGEVPFITNELDLLDEQGLTLKFKRFDTALDCGGVSTGCIKQKHQTNIWWRKLTSLNLEITRLDFYIQPVKNPYFFDLVSNQYLADQQPRVTIIIEGKSLGDSAEEEKMMQLQTTVSTRYYER